MDKVRYLLFPLLCLGLPGYAFEECRPFLLFSAASATQEFQSAVESGKPSVTLGPQAAGAAAKTDPYQLLDFINAAFNTANHGVIEKRSSRLIRDYSLPFEFIKDRLSEKSTYNADYGLDEIYSEDRKLEYLSWAEKSAKADRGSDYQVLTEIIYDMNSRVCAECFCKPSMINEVSLHDLKNDLHPSFLNLKEAKKIIANRFQKVMNGTEARFLLPDRAKENLDGHLIPEAITPVTVPKAFLFPAIKHGVSSIAILIDLEEGNTIQDLVKRGLPDYLRELPRQVSVKLVFFGYEIAPSLVTWSVSDDRAFLSAVHSRDLAEQQLSLDQVLKHVEAPVTKVKVNVAGNIIMGEVKGAEEVLVLTNLGMSFRMALYPQKFPKNSLYVFSIAQYGDAPSKPTDYSHFSKSDLRDWLNRKDWGVMMMNSSDYLGSILRLYSSQFVVASAFESPVEDAKKIVDAVYVK